MKKRKLVKWNENENNLLREKYPLLGAKKILPFFNRSLRAIKEQVKKLGLKMLEEERKKSNIKYSKETVENAVKNADCFANAIRNLRLIAQAGNYKSIKKLIHYYEIDTSHFLTQSELTKLRIKNSGFKQKQINIENRLTENSTIRNCTLKEKLYKDNIKERKCEECGQDENWRGRTFSLILDHINGINNDNRLENLRILCPNCNATLDTHCSNNRKIKTRQIKIAQPRKKKVPLPTLELLTELVKHKTYVEIGQQFGVSDNAVRKWFKGYGVEPPKKQKMRL